MVTVLAMSLEVQGESYDIPIECVRAGDHVKLASGAFAEVDCVYRRLRRGGEGKELVSIGGKMTITPGHPVRL